MDGSASTACNPAARSYPLRVHHVQVLLLNVPSPMSPLPTHVRHKVIICHLDSAHLRVRLGVELLQGSLSRSEVIRIEIYVYSNFTYLTRCSFLDWVSYKLMCPRCEPLGYFFSSARPHSHQGMRHSSLTDIKYPFTGGWAGVRRLSICLLSAQELNPILCSCEKCANHLSAQRS